MLLKFLDYKLTTQLPKEIGGRKKILANTLNPHSYCIARGDKEFQNALKASEILLPDGIGIVYATNLLYGKKIKKISGYDLHLHYLGLLNKQAGKVFYLGSSEFVLNKIKKKIEVNFPEVECAFYSPPFSNSFTNEENELMVTAINAFKPDLLFVGMTAPKQEKWVLKNKDRLEVPTIAAIGAVFDFYAGTVIRPNAFWINFGFEWLIRLLKEPKRLWRRTLISTPKFVILIMGHKIKAIFGLHSKREKMITETETKSKLKIHG
ncbi:WecB/TagA/CpsF family glycosyltransferase [uncultured Cyclobacterium sp.]|uniref:WecB/TagA/CpsF family glycosyltransferase n=1 Tax=uncultured Cyclobacterium sp. TaxID=453820 RepID=UPI0030ED7D47|tara:strand:- start:60489 stop:61280 length:792 start_codon:yes stop_codon:yes gene_type:complete